MKVWLIAIVLLTSGSLAWAQSSIEKADLALESGQRDVAQELLEQTLAKGGEPRTVAAAALRLGQLYREQGKLESSFHLLGKAFDGAESSEDAALVAEATLAYAIADSQLGDDSRRRRRAEKRFQRALKIFRQLKDGQGQARALLGLGNLYFRAQRWRAAEKFYGRAKALLETLPESPQRQQNLASVALNLGNIALKRDRDTQAAQEFYAQVDGLDSARLQNLGAALLESGQAEEALELFRKARQQAIAQNDVSGRAQAELNLALVFSRLGAHQRAAGLLGEALDELEASEAALAPWVERRLLLNRASALRLSGKQKAAARVLKKMKGAESEPSWHFEKAELARSEGNSQAAIEGFQRALSLLPQADLGTRGQVTLALAQAQLKLGQTEQAQESFQRVLTLSKESRTTLQGLAWRARFGLGLVARQQGQEQLAKTHYEKALVSISRLRGSFRNDELKTTFAEDKHPFYGELIDLHLALEQPNEAFLVSEQARGRSLLEMLRQAGLVERDLAPLSPSKVAKALPKNTTLLSYFSRAEETILFQLDGDGLKVRRLPTGQKALRTAVRKVRPKEDFAGEGGGPFPVEAAQALHKILIAPAGLSKGRHLAVLPDGPLHYLPFEMLHDGQAFLIEEHTISYAASATLGAGRPQQFSGKKLLVYAAPDEKGPPGSGRGGARGSVLRYAHDDFSPLPGAAEEARLIASHTPEHVKRVGGDCRENTFYKDVADGQYDILHFATHGFADDLNPLYSGILMTPEAPPEDGFLLAREVYTQRIPASLVVLSACSTGMGRVSAGEGMVGLTRAFQVAGVPRTIATLWPISDKASRDLMDELYRQMGAGLSTSEALRAAQLKSLRGEHQHPYLWAPFVLNGPFQG